MKVRSELTSELLSQCRAFGEQCKTRTSEFRAMVDPWSATKLQHFVQLPDIKRLKGATSELKAHCAELRKDAVAVGGLWSVRAACGGVRMGGSRGGGGLIVGGSGLWAVWVGAGGDGGTWVVLPVRAR